MRAAVLLLILVNVILFGYARLDRAAQSEAGRLGAQVQPDRIRVLTSQQVAALALFLCGDDAAQITGTNLSIDGGWTAE